MMNLKRSLFLILGVAILPSCVEPQKKASDLPSEKTILREKAVEPIAEHLERAYYPIPSPEKMFSFINDNGIPYSKRLINNIEKAVEYNHPEVKSIIFGMYTADLAYAAAYKDVETAIDLYRTVKTMSAELHIEEMMTEELLDEVLSHFENPDSLIIIAGDSYYDSVDFLEDHKQEDKLALMSLGGWLESIYITLNSLEEFDPETPTARRVAEQKTTFGNLYTYMQKHKDGIGVQDAINDLKAVRDTYAALEEVKSVKKVENSDELITTSHVKITVEQMEDLQAAVNAYRSKVVNDIKL